MIHTQEHSSKSTREAAQNVNDLPTPTAIIPTAMTTMQENETNAVCHSFITHKIFLLHEIYK